MQVLFMRNQGLYGGFIKRFLDIVLSLVGLVLLSPLFLLVALAIYFDDPGPVVFTQKRFGQNKRFFMLHKFRSMKTDTPQDVPTHLMENPEQHITRVGGFIRKYSLDELPQIWDILVGNMSIVGPRPALWNQDDLIEAREPYGANSLRPGLTGWAQINGRDELPIPVKAQLDGEYAKNLSFSMDLKCFLGTISAVVSHKGYAEGGAADPQTRKKDTK